MGRYYTAIVVMDGSVWTESFGSYDRMDMDCEVEYWIDRGYSKSSIKRKVWAKVPTQIEWEDWAKKF